MKIFETTMAPNTRRVRIFLAEKGIEMEYVQLDLQKGDNLSAEFRSMNPMAKVPVLELDDGTYLSESVAICRYFEELHPENPLFGTTPLEKAQIEMWNRRAELNFLMPTGMAFQHCTGFFADRMTPNKEWGEDCKKSCAGFIRFLDKRLADSEYVAGKNFSIADISVLCTLDFAKVIGIRPTPEQENVLRWYKAVSSRPSAQA